MENEWDEYENIEELLGPGMLVLEEPVLPSDPRQAVLKHEGKVNLAYYSNEGLAFLEPVFDLITSLVVQSTKADLGLLAEMPQLEDLDILGSIRKFPPEVEWEHLSGFSGPWQRGVDPFVSAPRLRTLALRQTTQEALDLLPGPLEHLALEKAKIADGSAGWRHPIASLYIDRTKVLDVGNFALLPTAEFTVFENIGELRGLDKASRDSPLGIVHLRGVESLGETDPWSIRAKEIAVDGSRNKPAWLAQAWPSRPDDWHQTWEPPYGWTPKPPQTSGGGTPGDPSNDGSTGGADFWFTIQRSRDASDGTTASQAEALRSILADMPAEDVADFDAAFVRHHQQLHSYGLWGAAYVLMGGCSDDGFTDFRSWIVAQGRDYFAAVLADPLALADGRLKNPDEVDDAETLSYVAQEVYEELSSRDIFDDHPDHPNINDADEPTGEPWEEGELDALYPQLTPLVWTTRDESEAT